jgi:eukaryotic-like serine/threonine-protein kinase
MPLNPGTKLGPYEILNAIGAGGMGEVYRARDTRLERSVAIKVLPQHLSTQQELRERFEREARTISTLNHPNICVLHDIGSQDGFDYLVMEYLEGETLAKRIEKGPLPVEQVLRHSVGIADALDKAHRQGIIHRDLKPGNIMITPAGAKLLDFGLAKFRQSDKQAGLSASILPTNASQLTMQGTILGTLQYMSPEQLENHETDTRSDLFSLGAVMYEMLTGRKAFEGKSQASIIAAIIHVDPPSPSVLQPVTPHALDRVINKCLAKSPDDRWQTAKDLADELRWIKEGGHSESLPAQTVSATSRRKHLGWAVAVFFFICAIALSAVILLHREPRTFGMIRVEINPPDKDPFLAFGNTPNFALSPDGRFFVFSVDEGGGRSRL